MSHLLQKIAEQNKFSLIDFKPLSGGDINEVFLLKCREGRFVAKLNQVSKFPGMFAAEARGLERLRQTASFKIPSIRANGEIENTSYLLMDYIPNGHPDSNFWEVFGTNLAALHKTTSQKFGLDHNNYIGSLPQYNDFRETASEFYISQRLAPQLELASANGFQFKGLSKFYTSISEEIPKEQPSLIHGDLWSGNYMVSEKGQPVLIDPAIGFAPREMDLAMMKLFGGFPDKVFTTYNSSFPLEPSWKDRVPLWQLYYLLVHLNLFGAGYLSRVKSIITKYT
ncbi:fructosamine kinase family protein [Aequorivita marina]|uniref:fructosamine kinase family protein n=1 Tax=Aequorivita marina TaxID=3073654 RepID=UPI00287680BD|nr:fructosamine kinase family protein [Aequorivita sp. S2608]MDS1297154.1 fructosamine kinase family protein [Aequorivita sp. S2608]